MKLEQITTWDEIRYFLNKYCGGSNRKYMKLLTVHGRSSSKSEGTPIEICKERDVKGLYKKAEKG